MEPTNPYAPPESGPELASAAASPPSASVVAGVAATTLLGTVFVYIVGQALVTVNLPLTLVFTSLFVFGAAGLVLPTAWNLDVRRFSGLDRVPWAYVGLAAVLALANFPAANFLMGLAQTLLPAKWAEDALLTTRLLAGATGATAALVCVAAGLAAPIGEELFFRGWLQGLATQRFRQVTSVVVVAIVFSTIHFDAVGFVARVELGVLFGLMRLWTGSLWPGLVLHATHNSVSLAVLYLSENPLADLGKPYPWADSLPGAAISVVATVGLLWWMRRWIGPYEPTAEAKPLPGVLPAFTLRPRAAIMLAMPLLVGALAFAAFIVLAGGALPGANMLDSAGVVAPPVPE